MEWYEVGRAQPRIKTEKMVKVTNSFSEIKLTLKISLNKEKHCKKNPCNFCSK